MFSSQCDQKMPLGLLICLAPGVLLLMVLLFFTACAFEDEYSENLRRDAERGDMEAMANYELRTKEPQGKVSVQPVKASERRDSLQTYDPEVQYQSGMQYAQGKFVTQDYDLAFSYFLHAAEANHPKAQFELSNCYKAGNGTAKDINLAYYWMYISAQNGNPKAVSALPTIALQLKSTEKEKLKTQADEWLQKRD